jgi:hypothetical protein
MATTKLPKHVVFSIVTGVEPKDVLEALRMVHIYHTKAIPAVGWLPTMADQIDGRLLCDGSGSHGEP